ncbi:MAG: DUF4276 family protein [Opitutus sp.]|nr:DUF4276 family protein [Opitutus sp.]
MSEVVFFLEELSARAMLEGFLPKLIPNTIRCRYIVFEGKQDLEKQMVKRMRGYRVPHARFVVLRDKDSEDCRQVKKRLVGKCTEAHHPASLVRVACHELESWYLGDLSAVEVGLGVSGLVRHQHKAPYDKPDDLAAAARKLRFIAPTYQKVSGSRAIGPHLNPAKNRSHSFGVFVAGIQKLVAA